jgi:hypothetical protein
MADQKLVIEIVLDDGSVVKGFANIKQEAKKVGQEVKSKDSLGALGDVFNTTAIGQFASKLKGVAGTAGAVGLAIAAIAAAAKETFDQALKGEQLNALESQFNTLASQAGLFGPTLKGSLDQASGGLVDVTELLRTANSAFINLGASAARLPEILELSRRATQVLGGDVKDRFDGIVQAIESGNVKALRQQGIILDIEKVYRDYAKTLGVTAGSLDLAQRQQAVLNATLEAGQRSFSKVSESITPIQNNLKQLSVASSEIGDAIAKKFNEVFGPAFQAVTKGLADLATSTSKFLSGNRVVDNIEGVSSEIDRLNLKIIENQKLIQASGENEFNKGPISRLKQDIEEASARIPFLKARLEELQMTAARAPAAPERNEEQERQARERAAMLAQIQFDSQNAFLQLEQQRIDAITNNDEKIAAQKALNAQRITQIDIAMWNELSALQAKFAANDVFTEEQKEKAKQDVRDKYQAARQSIQMSEAEMEVAFWKKLQAQITSIAASGLSQQLQIVGQNLQSQEALFAQFGNGVVAMFGDMLIATGNALIQQGLALEWFIEALNNLLPGSGFAAAAAGAALVIFGSALKASVGAGGASGPTGSVGAGGGGVTDTAQNPSNNFAATQEERIADTTVNLTIMGDVMDSDASSMRIIDLLNDAFDKKGVTIRRGLVASGA